MYIDMSGELRWENYKKLTKTLMMVFMNGKTAIDVSDFMKVSEEYLNTNCLQQRLERYSQQ